MTADIINLRPDRPNRRDFISIGAAVSAVMAGITPTAIAGTAGADQLPALVDEYFRLVDEVNGGGSTEHTDRAFEQGEALAQRIVAVVAPTAAGIVAQLRLLRDICDIEGEGWGDERDLQLLNSIVAGVERIGGAA